MRDAKKNNAHFRNSGACFNYGSACEYLNLCSGCDEPDSDRWQKKPKKHPELPDGIGGSGVLTNSRLRCFATCRRKHYYQYELGIERFDAERREALYFGSLFHEALDVWWRAHDERQKNGSNEQSVRRTDSRQAEAGLAF
jgi:ATP-dependent helicase/DNAse subunit B